MRPLAMAVKKLAVANKVKAKHIQRMQMNFFLIKCRRKPSANLRQKLKTHSIFPRQNPGTARERPRTERHSSTSRNVKRRCGINDAPSVRNSRSRKISCRSLRFSYRSPRNFYRSTCFSGRCGLSFLCGDCVWSWPKKTSEDWLFMEKVVLLHIETFIRVAAPSACETHPQRYFLNSLRCQART